MARTQQRKPALTLTSLNQLKALSNPLRFRILEHLTAEPRSPKQMADLLGTKPTQLYHHFRTLEHAGLVRRSGSKRKRGAIEQYYEAVSDRIAVDPKIFKGKVAPAASLYAEVFESTLHGLAEAERRLGPRERSRAVFVQHVKVRASQAQLAELRRMLDEWLDACRSTPQRDGGVAYGITCAFYPTSESA